MVFLYFSRTHLSKPFGMMGHIISWDKIFIEKKTIEVTVLAVMAQPSMQNHGFPKNTIAVAQWSEHLAPVSRNILSP